MTGSQHRESRELSRLIHTIAVVFAAGIIFAASFAFAQTSDVSQETMDAALSELSDLYGSPVVRPDQARAICNEEQYMVECAQIGKKYGLFPKERELEVDALLIEFKGKVVQELKQCGSTECLIELATQIARQLSGKNPTLARDIDLTVQKVGEKQSIVDTARSIGVDIEECRAMDPDSASVELLRGCARLAKHERVRDYIPEENRGRVEKTENTAALKEALASGEFACGDGTIEGCGAYCLSPSAEAQEAAANAIPAVCRQIAERFFGPEGVSDLERAHQNVRVTYDEAKDIYMEREDNFYERREVGPNPTTTPARIQCPTIEYSPCSAGEYRQESVSEFGCFTKSACIPFNTKTMAEQDKKNMRVVCPAMPTVDSCSAAEERVVDFSSPECGTYYVCRPKVEGEANINYPYAFRSGRVALSFDEARIYCYESGGNGATVRGDKEECLRTFNISVPDIPPEKQQKQCSDWGSGWHNMEESGNCFNPSMTEYRTPGGALQICANVSVYGCTSSKGVYEPSSGEKEQVWNSLGLRSWIRSDASEKRITDLKGACAMTAGNANVWLSDAGTNSSPDFGMPDPDKCAKAAACTSAQYFNGSECKEIGTSEWCSGNQYWNGNSCVPIPPVTPSTTTSGSGTGTATSSGGNYQGDAASCPGFAYSRWDSRGARYCQLNTRVACQFFYPQYLTESNYSASSCPAGESTTGVSGGGVSGSCSSELTALLGTGCHSMGSGWFNSGMTSYVLPGSTVVKSCTSDWVSGCSGSGGGSGWGSGGGSSDQREQVWNSQGLRSWIRNDADSARIESLKQRCANVPSSSNVWMPSAGDYASSDFGMPSADKCDTASSCSSSQYFDGASCTSSSSGGSGTSCSSGQYWNGSACVSSTSGGGSGGTSSMSRCFYPNATIDGTPPGYTVWCESDYYNCHVGEPSGASISLSGLALGAPSTCESGWSGGSTGGSTTGSECRSQTSQSACSAVSGCYWYTGYSGSYCDSSGSSASSGSGGGSSSCPSGQYWSGSACMPSEGSYGSGSGSSCGSNLYWDSASNSCRSMQDACSTAGGTWDSSSSYCRMPTSSASKGSPLAFLCPAGHEWNGSYCTQLEPSQLTQFLASAIGAFRSLFAP